MESLPTFYRGIHFRSQLEARWAFFFDALVVPYHYEPKVFQVEPNLSYLPDFWLPSQRIWVEIKPDEPTEAEERKVVGLHRITGQKVLIFAGFPNVMPFSNSTDRGYRPEICNFGIFIVDANAPNRCTVYTIGTLNETLLYVFGLLTQSAKEDTFRTNTKRLADAVKQSNDYFTRPQSMHNLIRKYLGDISSE